MSRRITAITLVLLVLKGAGAFHCISSCRDCSCLTLGVSSGGILRSSRRRSERCSRLFADAPDRGTKEIGDPRTLKGSIQENLTSVVMEVSYDGSRYSGWTAPNSKEVHEKTSQWRPLSAQERRRDKLFKSRSGVIRSVSEVLKANLAKVFGNVDLNRIQLESSSRTDAGVHARGLIVQVYCLSEEYQDWSPVASSIPGKRLPHPTSPTDSSCFESIAFGGDISRMAYALNRMLPNDIRVRRISPTPATSNDMNRPFHPSLDSIEKTYTYRITVGKHRDPLAARTAWNIPAESFDLDAVKSACNLLRETRDFRVLSSMLRGEERESYSTTCTLSHVEVRTANPSHALPIVPDQKSTTYVISVTGDRFLYKMMRHIAGAMVSIGTGKQTLGELRVLLQSGNVSKRTFPCAPAYGLVLERVHYDDNTVFEWQPF